MPPKCPIMVAEWKARRGQWASCTRSKEKQRGLVIKLCGKPVSCGRASMTSNHLSGCACDFGSRSPASPVHGGKWMKNTKKNRHSGNHMSPTGR